MGRNKYYLALIVILTMGGNMLAQDFFDDIYYNPKKDKSVTTASVVPQNTSRVVEQRQSNYIADLGNMDVDTYNRRGSQYYISDIDTIGNTVSNAEDFVYTQEIQKYYNPTIVVDNAAALGDVLSNAYGNVDIIINNNGYPVFGPYYGWNWPYYSSVWNPWNWGISIGGWGWSLGWYDPWYSWNWGWSPGWWNPGPVWGPGFRPGPGWGPGPGPIASWNPGAGRPIGPRPGWSLSTQHKGNLPMQSRPGGNFAPGNNRGGAHRVGGSVGGNPTGVRPSGVVNNNGRWEYNRNPGNSGNHRTPGLVTSPTGNNKTQTTGTHRGATNSSKSGSTVTNNRTTTNRSTVTNNRTPSRTGGTTRPSGGGRSTGGGSRGGGGGRHR